MKVKLVTAADAPWSRKLSAAVEAVARADRIGEHALVDDAEEAELILFLDLHQHPADWRMSFLRDHPLVRAFPSKAFVYDERDVPRDSLPGIYVAMPQSELDPGRHRPFAYYFLLNDTRSARDDRPDLLVSFRGRRAGHARDDVLALSHPRGVFEDSSGIDFFDDAQVEQAEAKSRYRELVGRSKFVLCPPGAGTSSVRLFETLAGARVPVIVSEEWSPPLGIDWQSCSIRVAERDVHSVIEQLEALEPQWPTMSAAAAEVYDEWFAPDVWFHRAVEHCRELMQSGAAGLNRQWTTAAYWRAAARHVRASRP